jgi:hypothetical protein
LAVVGTDVAYEGKVGDLLTEEGDAVERGVVEGKGGPTVGIEDGEEGGGGVGGAVEGDVS